MREFWAFVRSGLTGWVASMSGIASLLTSLWLQVTGNQAVSPRAFAWVGVACLFVACYQAWLKEHRARVAAERACDEKDAALAGERASAAMRIVRCDRCHKDVPLWFFDKTRPLPDADPSELIRQFMRERNLSFPEAQLQATLFRPEDEYGCLMCAGRERTYPLPHESREEFSARTRKPIT